MPLFPSNAPTVSTKTASSPCPWCGMKSTPPQSPTAMKIHRRWTATVGASTAPSACMWCHAHVYGAASPRAPMTSAQAVFPVDCEDGAVTASTSTAPSACMSCHVHVYGPASPRAPMTSAPAVSLVQLPNVKDCAAELERCRSISLPTSSPWTCCC